MLDSRHPDLLINVVAVDTRQVVWQVWCEICDDEVSETMADGDLADIW